MPQHPKMSKQDLIIFSRQLALVIDSDISIHEGLSIIHEKSEHPQLKGTVENLKQLVAQGHSLSEAMSMSEEYFPNYIQSMIKIGEESGELGTILEQIADNYERELETSAKFKRAITYPAILSILMLAVIFILILRILPMFNEILTSLGGSMPAMTRTIMSASLFIGRNIVPITLSAVLIVGVIYAYLRSSAGKKLSDKLAFQLPIFGPINAAMVAVRFARNMAMLITSGLSMSRAFKLIAPIFNNDYVESKFQAASQAIDRGQTVESVIEQLNLFPAVLIKLFAVANATGHMDRMLVKAAHTMESELDYRLERLTTVIEPILITVLSVIVGAILIAVILPIIDIMNAIG